MDPEEIFIYVGMFVVGVISSAFIFNLIYSSTFDSTAATWTFPGHEALAGLLKVVPMLFLIAMITIPLYKLRKLMG